MNRDTHGFLHLLAAVLLLTPGALGQVSAVVNGASFAGAPSPGSVATVFGAKLASTTAQTTTVPLPVSLGGATVTVNGVIAPLWYVSPSQINFEMPAEVKPGSASIVVSAAGSSSFTVPLVAPGIFVYGANRAIAVNKDNSLNDSSHPAALGSVITVYLTGIGPLDNPVASNMQAPSKPLSRATLSASATIGNQNASIHFLGLTAGGIALAQANLTVPSLSAGEYPLIITIGGVASNAPVITVADLSGFFTPTARMLKVVGIHTATLLADGKVLIAGGSTGTFNYTYGGLRVAELYDPVAGSFTATGSMTSGRTFHTASLLPNGKVLVTGGFDGGHPDRPLPESSAELYDPATGSFTPAGTMGIARADHTATLLPNGKVLIAGGAAHQIVDTGFPFFGSGFAESEVYDPATNSFTTTGAMSTARFAHTATLLPNGKVLIAGGFPYDSAGALLTAELYDTATGTFSPTGNMGTPRGAHTATVLGNGNVLVSGGLMRVDATATAPSAELYDPATGAFTPTGSMAEARERHTATLLPDGRVLIAGGNSETDTLTSAEIYDPLTGSFAITGSMGTPRSTHTATLLPDGTVLVAGGNYVERPGLGDYSYSTGTAEVYHQQK